MAEAAQAAEVAILRLILDYLAAEGVTLRRRPPPKELSPGARRAVACAVRLVGAIVRRWPFQYPGAPLALRRYVIGQIGNKRRTAGGLPGERHAGAPRVEKVLGEALELCRSHRLRPPVAWLDAPDGVSEQMIEDDARAIAARYPLSSADREAVRHDTFSRFYVSRGLTPNPRAYARRIAKNLCLDLLKRDAGLRELDDDAIDALAAPRDEGTFDVCWSFQVWREGWRDERGARLVELEFLEDLGEGAAHQRVFDEYWPLAQEECCRKLRKEHAAELAAYQQWAADRGSGTLGETFDAWCRQVPQERPSGVRALLRRVLVNGCDLGEAILTAGRERYHASLRTAKSRALINFRAALAADGFSVSTKGGR